MPSEIALQFLKQFDLKQKQQSRFVPIATKACPPRKIALLVNDFAYGVRFQSYNKMD